MTIDAKLLDEMATRLSQQIPPGVKTMQEEVQRQFKQVLQSFLAKMELVTREEFDVQTKVLQKTRQRLSALEAQVVELEKQLNKQT